MFVVPVVPGGMPATIATRSFAWPRRFSFTVTPFAENRDGLRSGATPQVQTQRWLESKGFRLPSVFVVQGSRGRIAAALAGGQR